MKKLLFFCLALLTMFLTSCAVDEEWKASEVCPEAGTNRYGMSNRGTFTDERDGQIYAYTTIGDQVWMAENLRFNAKYSLCYGLDSLCSDGGMGHQCILKTTNLDVVGEKIAPDCEDVKCVAERFCDRFGRFYSLTERGTSIGLMNRELIDTLCPKGWHVPSKEDFERLVDAIGGKSKFFRLVSSDSSTHDFSASGEDAGKWTDDCGFSALFTGGIYSSDCALFRPFHYTLLATSTAVDVNGGFDVFLGEYIDFHYETFRMSVRCLKD